MSGGHPQGTPSPATRLRHPLRRLPDELQRDLDHPARLRGVQDSAKAGRAYRVGGIGEIHLVKGVEELAAKLGAERLADQQVPHQGKIRIVQRRPADYVTPHVAERAQRYLGRRNKGRGVKELVDKRVAVRMI